MIRLPYYTGDLKRDPKLESYHVEALSIQPQARGALSLEGFRIRV